MFARDLSGNFRLNRRLLEEINSALVQKSSTMCDIQCDIFIRVCLGAKQIATPPKKIAEVPEQLSQC